MACTKPVDNFVSGPDKELGKLKKFYEAIVELQDEVNLIEEALQALPGGGAAFLIRAVAQDQDGNFKPGTAQVGNFTADPPPP